MIKENTPYIAPLTLGLAKEFATMTRTVPPAPSLPWGRIGERGAASLRTAFLDVARRDVAPINLEHSAVAGQHLERHLGGCLVALQARRDFGRIEWVGRAGKQFFDHAESRCHLRAYTTVGAIAPAYPESVRTPPAALSPAVTDEHPHQETHMTFASIVFVIAAAVIICGLVLTGRSL